MSTYKVEAAQQAKRLPAKGDRPELAVHAYTLSENGSTVQVERVAKLDTPLPAVGSMIEGTIESTNFGKRFKPERQGGGGGRGPFKRDPSETRAIQRQHSQEMALRYIGIKAQLGNLPGEDFGFEDVKKMTDAFERDLAPPTPKSDVPVDEDGLPPLNDLTPSFDE